MISSQHRFHGRTSLSLVYRHGHIMRDNSMALRYVRNSRRQTYRLAVVVSRKIHKSAVQRNRVRRRIYALIQGYENHVTGPFDLLLTIYSDQVIIMSPAELERTVIRLLTKSGVVPAHLRRLTTIPRAIVDTSKERP